MLYLIKTRLKISAKAFREKHHHHQCAIYKCKIANASKRLKRKFLREHANCYGSNDVMTTSEFSF